MKSAMPSHTTSTQPNPNPNLQFQPISTTPLFITNLDPNITHEELHRYFLRFGPIIDLQLGEKPSITGPSKYAYLRYLMEIDAETALVKAQYAKFGNNNIRIRFFRDIRDNLFETTLFIKNIPAEAVVADLWDHFGRIGIVAGVSIDNSLEGKFFGCGCVQFANKEDAETALEELQGKELQEKKFKGSPLQLVSFFPRDFRKKLVMKGNVRIKELPREKTEEELKRILSDTLGEYGEIKGIDIEEGYFATVCFKEEEDGQAAYNDLSRERKEYQGLEGEFCVLDKEEEKADNKQEVNKRSNSGSDSDDIDPFYECQKKDDIMPPIVLDGREKVRKPYSNQSGSKPKENQREMKWRAGQKQAEKNTTMMKTIKKYQQKVVTSEFEKRFGVTHEEFLKYDAFKQRKMLRRELLPLVEKISGKQFAEKISDRLTDLTLYVRAEILDMIENHDILDRRVKDAMSFLGLKTKPNRHVNEQKLLEKQEEIAWIAESHLNVEYDKFLSYDKDKQKEKLAKVLFPRIRELIRDDLAPKVTGMLADPSFYDIDDIIRFIDDKELLEEKVKQMVKNINYD